MDGAPDIKALLNQAYAEFGNPMLIHDMEYKLVAYTDDVITDDPIWNEYVTTGTVSSERLAFFMEEGFLTEAANTKEIALLTSKKLKYDRLYGKLFAADGIQIGCVVLLASDRPFQQGDAVAFEAACAKLSLAFKAHQSFTHYGLSYQSKLLGELINNEHLDRGLYAAHVESLYMHLKAILYVAVADVPSNNNQQMLVYKDLLRKAQPDYIYATYEDHVLVILSLDSADLSLYRDFDKLKPLLLKNGISMGVSSPFENLFEIRKYYQEAMEALEAGKPHKQEGPVFMYKAE